MKYKIKMLIAITISLLPFNFLRVFLYRTILQYKIKQSQIGWLTILSVKEIVMSHNRIGSFNLFTGPFSMRLEKNTKIGSFNYFRCGLWAINFTQKSELILKQEAHIGNQHYFDLFGKISIGKQSIIAGIRSQFWTHGSFTTEVDIHIGDNCYIGSGVKMTPNSSIQNNSMCAMGSIITKQFKEDSITIAGVPAKIIKKNINWREEWK